jgi:hypothetical protein
VANIVNRSAWSIRRHNYLVRHCSHRVAGSMCVEGSSCVHSISSLLRENMELRLQCFGCVAGSVCITKSFGAPGTPYS